MRRLRLVDAQGNLVGDADAVAFEGNDFFRMIGEDANVLEAEIDQDLRADAALVLNQTLAGRLAIQLSALVEMDLRKRAGFFRGIHGESAPGVVKIEENAAVFLGDSGKRAGDELGAVALAGSETIADQPV